jgi:hypothetical protein
MNPVTQAIAALGFFGMLIALICVTGVSFQRWVAYKQRKAELDDQARRAALTDRADLADLLEERVRVLERIATDRGQDIAHQIESLRDRKSEARLVQGSETK